MRISKLNDGAICIATDPKEGKAITKAQAGNNGGGAHEPGFHYTGRKACTRVFGPKGGTTEVIARVSRHGSVKTWANSPEKWEMVVVNRPMGIRAFVDHLNTGHYYHAATDCPLRNAPRTRAEALKLLGDEQEVKFYAEKPSQNGQG